MFLKVLYELESLGLHVKIKVLIQEACDSACLAFSGDANSEVTTEHYMSPQSLSHLPILLEKLSDAG